MKMKRPLIGVLFSLVASLLAGAPAQDIKSSSSPRVYSPSGKDRTPGPDGRWVDGSRRGRLEDTVEIVDVREGAPDASGMRQVTIRVRYALVHYSSGVLGLGFNLKSATSFTQVASRPVRAGSEETELSARIAPPTWSKGKPFKLWVGLSAEPRPEQWSLLAAVTRVMKPSAAPPAKKGATP